MKPYCLKCKTDTENLDEAEGLLSNLGIRTPFSKLPILGDILF